MLDAAGEPHLFDQGQVLVGEGIRYDTCRRRGVIKTRSPTSTRGRPSGSFAATSPRTRAPAGSTPASSEITSCDLPTPHYHFAARQVKWISRSVLVARPVMLYVRDVPILWLPFIFQDMRPGRHSGILIPQFGINDLVRPTRRYNRQVTNLGYYWAPNDYLDLTGRLDWFANRYVQYGVDGAVPLARPVRGRHGRAQRAAPGGRRIGAGAPLGPPADLQPLHQPQPQPQLRQQHARRPRQRDRSAAEHPADQQLAQLLQALRLGHRSRWAATGGRASPTAASSSCCRR